MKKEQRNKSEYENNVKKYDEKRTPLDEQENQKFADDIPLEDLKIEQEDEKKKEKTKDDSQSERKYHNESHKL
ncbi:hypothetical protein D8M04_00630 [Oceanobacillus piezotolerans]|uniref:Uncharacterized protein n=1 Tax=Oceanobacillus piezotolerans TaxID=2448030 RepID=A0A498DLA6_9BACI|nr:hypothetical protein [Oceanobacillus piezotolerans]RLL47820.1 hypothetical protein D8M04_00630 [Oceanobacillus piezotolerans]